VVRGQEGGVRCLCACVCCPWNSKLHPRPPPQGWDLGPVPAFEALGLEDDDDDDDDEGGFRGGARALARDTRRVWAEERARFEAALRRRQRQALGRGVLHLPSVLSPVLEAAAAGGGGAAMPASSPLLQALSSLVGGEGGDEEEREEAEEDARELLAFAVSWSPTHGLVGEATGGGLAAACIAASAVATTTPSSSSKGGSALASAAVALASALRRLLPLLALAGGLPWLLHHHCSMQGDAQPPSLAHKTLLLLATALLRQLGVVLAAPYSRALRRACFLLSFVFLAGAMVALAWAAASHRCVFFGVYWGVRF